MTSGVVRLYGFRISGYVWHQVRISPAPQNPGIAVPSRSLRKRTELVGIISVTGDASVYVALPIFARSACHFLACSPPRRAAWYTTADRPRRSRPGLRRRGRWSSARSPGPSRGGGCSGHPSRPGEASQLQTSTRRSRLEHSLSWDGSFASRALLMTEAPLVRCIRLLAAPYLGQACAE